MTVAADWVADVRSHLDGERGERFNRLAANYTAGSGTVTLLRDVSGIGENSVITVGLNTFLVEAVSATAKTLTVLGGHNGSTDADAIAGDLVRVAPRFTDHRIFRALNDALSQLSNPRTGLWGVDTVEVTYDGVREGYGLTAPGLLDVVAVSYDTTGPELAWPRLSRQQWDVTRSADTTDFPTGYQLRVRGGVETGRTVRVTYAKALEQLTALTDDVADTGLHEEAWDIPVMRAALRLMSGREIPRTAMGSQSDPRRAEEVPPGATFASTRGLQGWLDRRVAEESARLRSRYPIGM
jgi:hypothetical protein